MMNMKTVGEGVGFSRTVRITGYLTTLKSSKNATVNRLNDAKRDEIYGTNHRTVNELRCEECDLVYNVA